MRSPSADSCGRRECYLRERSLAKLTKLFVILLLVKKKKKKEQEKEIVCDYVKYFWIVRISHLIYDISSVFHSP